jgi:predicted ATPase/class 3 adenylate cyclase
MLFSDIEGSTRLLNRLGSAYPDILATHRQILRRAFAHSRGREVGTEGDSFFVVFESAAQAVTAAAEGQQALEAHPWPGGVTMRVRMGLHAGHPEPFEDNLVGLDVHVAARVAATAHGGQVVLSQAAVDEVADRLPPGTSLRDLGVHRLKDIVDAQRLSQLVIPGMPATFPPLRSLGAPGNLPAPTGPLVGRGAELTAVGALLTKDRARLVTLSGPGGAGKTRLSITLAEEVAESFVDGVHFVDLSAATDDAVAWRTLSETLGRSNDTETELLDHLRDRNVLLVLDNLEQLPAAGATVVTRLLGATTRLRLLATSRRPLRVAGEQEYPVPPLGLPAAGRATPSVEVAARADSVRFFVQQARLADPRFLLSDDNVADVVAVCRRLDGLPLAIELAAARVRLLPPSALLEHLDEALGLPLSGHPQRQQTLPATVGWSYRMVGPGEQRAFRALAAFGSSGGTFDAVAAVLEVPSALSAVSGLLDAALVRVEDDPAGPRVRLLHPVRYVARQIATNERELDDLLRAHASYFLELAEREGERMRGPGALAARTWIELEMDNLRVALDWSLGDGPGDSPGDEARIACGIRMCTALSWYWYVTGYDAESRRWLERASRAAAGRHDPQLAQLLHSFGLLFLQQGDNGHARDVLAKSLRLWQRAGDRVGETKALNSLGVAYRSLGETDRARALLQQSVDVALSLDNPQRQATALTNLALLEIDAGRPETALPMLAEAERLDLSLDNAWGVAADRVNLAAALLASARPAQAMDLLRDLSGSVTDHGDPDLTLGVIEMLAYAASTVGDHVRAVRLAACADHQRSSGDLPLSDVDRTFLERQLAVSRRALGDAADESERAGRALTVPSALGEAAAIAVA